MLNKDLKTKRPAKCSLTTNFGKAAPARERERVPCYALVCVNFHYSRILVSRERKKAIPFLCCSVFPCPFRLSLMRKPSCCCSGHTFLSEF